MRGVSRLPKTTASSIAAMPGGETKRKRATAAPASVPPRHTRAFVAVQNARDTSDGDAAPAAQQSAPEQAAQPAQNQSADLTAQVVFELVDVSAGQPFAPQPLIGELAASGPPFVIGRVALVIGNIVGAGIFLLPQKSAVSSCPNRVAIRAVLHRVKVEITSRPRVSGKVNVACGIGLERHAVISSSGGESGESRGPLLLAIGRILDRNYV